MKKETAAEARARREKRDIAEYNRKFGGDGGSNGGGTAKRKKKKTASKKKPTAKKKTGSKKKPELRTPAQVLSGRLTKGRLKKMGL